ncbi:aldehyde dehydrogenase family protein, partial [Mycobacterium kansasii]
DVIDATTEEVIGRVAAGTAEDADAAVAAARAAFDGWSRTPLEERIGFLTRAAQALQVRQTEIATLVSQEVGMPFA